MTGTTGLLASGLGASTFGGSTLGLSTLGASTLADSTLGLSTFEVSGFRISTLETGTGTGLALTAGASSSSSRAVFFLAGADFFFLSLVSTVAALGLSFATAGALLFFAVFFLGVSGSSTTFWPMPSSAKASRKIISTTAVNSPVSLGRNFRDLILSLMYCSVIFNSLAKSAIRIIPAPLLLWNPHRKVSRRLRKHWQRCPAPRRSFAFLPIVWRNRCPVPNRPVYWPNAHSARICQ